MLLSRGGTQGVSDGIIHQSGIIYQDADADSEFGVGFLVLFSSNFLEDFLEHIRACKSQNPSLAVKVKILSRLGVILPPPPQWSIFALFSVRSETGTTDQGRMEHISSL